MYIKGYLEEPEMNNKKRLMKIIYKVMLNKLEFSMIFMGFSNQNIRYLGVHCFRIRVCIRYSITL
jgi:hypothetical protein